MIEEVVGVSASANDFLAPLSNERNRVRGRARVRSRLKNENDYSRERKSDPRRLPFSLLAIVPQSSSSSEICQIEVFQVKPITPQGRFLIANVPLGILG
jgi:hypothetical protein